MVGLLFSRLWFTQTPSPRAPEHRGKTGKRSRVFHKGRVVDPDDVRRRAVKTGDMTYAVVWRENEGSNYSGRLELQASGIVLSGSNAGLQRAVWALDFDDLIALHLERRVVARQMTQPTLVLVTRSGDRIEIASLEGLGVLHEVAERVESARGKAAV